MADTLKQLGREVGQTIRGIEFANRRGGLLPQVEGTRGNVTKTGAFIAPFRVKHSPRKVSLRLEFYKANVI